jgi:rhodanese-related sulfurtransferase
LCDSCERFHAVKVGGPRAALERAFRYLDAWHQGHRLKKVTTPIRGNPIATEPESSDMSGQSADGAEFPRMEPGDLRQLMESGRSITVLDARSSEAWEEATSKIRGDIRIDRDSLDVGASVPRDRLTVVYCTCPRDAGAIEVGERLMELGFTNLSVLRGGFDAWQAAGGPIAAK